MGKGRLPITGGLFLEEAAELLTGDRQFAITQDQRNTASARLRYQLGSLAWTAIGWWYGSGLPLEREDSIELDELEQAYGARVLRRVDFARGRVKPSFSIDLSGGIDLWRRESGALRLQADALNLTDQLNVINFAGVFSGTAIAPPRTFGARLSWTF